MKAASSPGVEWEAPRPPGRGAVRLRSQKEEQPMSVNADEVSVDTAECEVVRGIIERYLLNHDSISKFYVVEQIKRYINPIRLFNIAIDSGPVTHDGAKNVHLGAEQVYRKAIKALKGRYVCRQDGWIVAVSGSAGEQSIMKLYELDNVWNRVNELEIDKETPKCWFSGYRRIDKHERYGHCKARLGNTIFLTRSEAVDAMWRHIDDQVEELLKRRAQLDGANGYLAGSVR